MKKSRIFTFLQLVSGILAIYGIYITAIEYMELKTHVEWSTPAYYSLIKMGIVILTAVLFTGVLQWMKRKR